MALLYYDGFETYGVVPTSATATGVNATTPLTAMGWTGNVITTVTGTNIARPATVNDPDARSWLSSLNGPAASTTWINPRRASTMYANTAGNYIIVGYKVCLPTQYPGGTTVGQVVGRVFFDKYLVDVMTLPGVNSNILAGNGTAPTSISGALNNGASVTVGPSTWQPGLANTIEIQLDNTGVYTVWVNNLYVGTGNAQVKATGDYGGRGIIFFEGGNSVGSVSGAYPYYITDFYMLDDQPGGPTTRLGKVKVVTRLPTTDVQAQLTRPSGAPSNASVAASVPPTASNYLTGVADGDTDLYSGNAFNFSNEAIIATALVTSGYKTDVTGNDVAGVLKIGSTVYEGAKLQLAVGTTYKTGMSIFTTNPATGLKFTKADLDNAPFGVRVKDPNA